MLLLVLRPNHFHGQFRRLFCSYLPFADRISHIQLYLEYCYLYQVRGGQVEVKSVLRDEIYKDRSFHPDMLHRSTFNKSSLTAKLMNNKRVHLVPKRSLKDFQFFLLASEAIDLAMHGCQCRSPFSLH